MAAGAGTIDITDIDQVYTGSEWIVLTDLLNRDRQDLRRELKASVEEEVNVHRSEIEKNAFKVFKLKQLLSCLILTLSIQEKDRWVWFSTLNLRIYFYIAFIL